MIRKSKFYNLKNKQTRRISLLLFCITLFLTSLNLNVIIFELFNESSIRENRSVIDKKSVNNPSTSDYTLVGPINISSPSDWALYPFITGNGSDVNPYIIENIEIQGKGVKTMEDGPHTYLNYTYSGILINAGGRFIIRNCKISSVSIGIQIAFGSSTGHIHNINSVEITNCGIGIYCTWMHIAINISKCDISNCNLVTVKVPSDFDPPIFYGGCGIYIKGDDGTVVEYCYIQNCSIGVLASGPLGGLVDINHNQLINCGILFDFAHILNFNSIFNNSVNGKPLGLFLFEDNRTITGQEASQYGQLIFVGCDNLHLSDIHIKDPCSFGLIITHCNNPELQNIVCENQKIGFLFIFSKITADNLHTKNCDAGFFLIQIRDSTFTRLFMDNNDIPIYTLMPIINCTIEIEKSTRFYIIDFFAFDELQLNSSVSSFNVNRSFISAFDLEGFIIQINDTQTYHITDTDPGIQGVDFTIVIFEPPQPLIIPSFPLFWFYLALVLGILYLNASYRRKRQINKKSV